MAKFCFVLLLAAAFTGCAESDNAINAPQPALCTTPTDTAPPLGSPFNMRFGGQSTIVDTDLTLKFTSIADGRCPGGILCLIAGQADVVIRVFDSQHIPADLSLTTLWPASQGSYHEFDIHLLQVTPYPEDGRPPTPEAGYCVQLIVTRALGGAR